MKKQTFIKLFAEAAIVIALLCFVAECVIFGVDPQFAQTHYDLYMLLLVLSSVVGGLVLALIYFRSYTAAVNSIDTGENEITRLTAELKQFEELAARREEFIAAFAHELKTPLTAIIGYADMLRSKDMAPKPRFTAAGYIFSEGKRLEALSLKLLDIIVVGKQDLEKRRYDAGVLIREVAAVALPSVSDDGISLDIRWEKGEVEIEPDLFKTLLINILDNARKACKRGQNIDFFGKCEENGYAFYVTDHGRGMKPEDLQKISEPFYMVDKSRSRAQNGAGLGLALCKSIAELHGTSLQYISELGKGTTVRVFLSGGTEI